MKDCTIKEVKKLARELIELIDNMESAEKELKSPHGDYHYNSPKHRGAVRRKSMDLTRALAEMRKA